jgi:uncharacterized membrane protein YeaQ/YmgE (transglycosylase-associated protein family)
MTLVLCILIGAAIGQWSARRFGLGGAEWRRFTTVGGVVGAMLSYWLLADADEPSRLQLDQLWWSALASAGTVLLMHRLRQRRSE